MRGRTIPAWLVPMRARIRPSEPRVSTNEQKRAADWQDRMLAADEHWHGIGRELAAALWLVGGIALVAAITAALGWMLWPG